MKISVQNYNLLALQEACDESDLESMVVASSKSTNPTHTPIDSPLPKRLRSVEEGETSMAILSALQLLTKKVDEQTELLKGFDKRIEVNKGTISENKAEISVLQKKVAELQIVNSSLKKAHEEQARYNRRWNLRMIGLQEKDGEDARKLVIGILTRVVPLSVDRLRDRVDVVHRLGIKRSDGTPRPIIIRFGMRNVRDDVWRKSKDARVCKEMHIRFKENFSKEDREARAKLWPLVQEVRKRGTRAFLKEGYALIDNPND